MPNTSEGQGANLSGPADPSRLQRPADGEEERSLISSLARDAARVRRASSAELHLPWTCPVTHSREKFYTVCSDYALLNQAASVYCPPNTARDVVPNKQDDGPSFVKPKPSVEFSAGQSGGSHVGSDGDYDMVEVTSKPILAWEIDTTDFNAVLTRKTRTSKKRIDKEAFICFSPGLAVTDSCCILGNVKKCTKKMKSSDRPSRNLQDASPHASLEEIKQRKVLDLRRW